MSTQVVDTPGGLPIAGFYYPELKREWLSFLRNNREQLGLTDENKFELHVQMGLSFMYACHLNNVRLDVLATEMFLDTAQLLQSMRSMMGLMGISLKSATPSIADLVCKLSSSISTLKIQFIPALASFGTESFPPIVFEASSDGLDLNPTNVVSHVFSAVETDSGSGSGGVSVWASGPDVIEFPTGPWAADIEGQVIHIPSSAYGNHGEFLVTERIDDNNVRVVRASDGKAPAFVTEPSLTFSAKKFADYTTEANTGSSTFVPWPTPVVGDLLYVCHTQVQFNKLSFVFNPAATTNITGVWEYFDDHASLFKPDSVVNNGSDLTFGVDSLLGSSNVAGAIVTIQYLPTGRKETVVSTYSSGNKVTSNGLFGQTSPSTNPEHYLVTADWVPFDGLTDGTVASGSALSQNGDVEFTLPQTETRRWSETQINSKSGPWARFRILTVNTPVAPVIDRIKIDEGDQYLMFEVTQGETVGPVVVGSGSGKANQAIALPLGPYLDDSETIEVDETGSGGWQTYKRVDTMAESNATSRHYLRSIDANDRCVGRFGDGTNGRIPTAALNNIRGTWRVGGDLDGNVGAQTIVSSTNGIPGISQVFNPRPATGWRVKDGGTSQSFERLRYDAPGQRRTRNRATAAQDIPRLAVDFVNENGTKPVERAWVQEDALGLKVAQLVCVGAGGALLSQGDLDEVATYFNGDRWVTPAKEGVVVWNHQVICVNHEPRLVTVEVDLVWPGGNTTQVKNQLLAYFHPLARNDSGSAYLWEGGGSISLSKVYDLLHNISPNIRDISTLFLNGSASSITLRPNELPWLDEGNITVRILSV